MTPAERARLESRRTDLRALLAQSRIYRLVARLLPQPAKRLDRLDLRDTGIHAVRMGQGQEHGARTDPAHEANHLGEAGAQHVGRRPGGTGAINDEEVGLVLGDVAHHLEHAGALRADKRDVDDLPAHLRDFRSQSLGEPRASTATTSSAAVATPPPARARRRASRLIGGFPRGVLQ